jgi:hypothetical protein
MIALAIGIPIALDGASQRIATHIEMSRNPYTFDLDLLYSPHAHAFPSGPVSHPYPTKAPSGKTYKRIIPLFALHLLLFHYHCFVLNNTYIYTALPVDTPVKRFTTTIPSCPNKPQTV